VTILVDRENKTIEFYDSKGLTIKDQASRKLRFPSQSLTTLEDHVNQIWKNFGADASWTFKENTTRHQTDAYNCGIYVSNFIQRRLHGETFESIQRNGLSFQKACGSARESMIQTLLT
jgi:Ulp1 family protease